MSKIFANHGTCDGQPDLASMPHTHNFDVFSPRRVCVLPVFIIDQPFDFEDKQLQTA